jgi:CHAT domain-containing protein
MVKRALLADYRVIYFGTHRLISGDVTGLSEPFLALSQPGKPSDRDDGTLTASEVAQLKLNAEWVVLTASNAAIGDSPPSNVLPELARAVLYAGARAMLVAHWTVDQPTAARLTTSLFEIEKKHPTLGRAEVLRRAMLASLNDPAEPSRAYPAFWGPFSLIGEGAAAR